MLRLLAPLAVVVSLAAFAAEEPPSTEQPKPEQPSNEPKPKLVIIPFAALSPDVPARAGQKALGMLATEIKNAESFQLLDVKKDKDKDVLADALSDARAAVDEAKQHRAKRKFRLADEALQKALTTYRAAAAGVTDVAEVADAYALLSAVQFNTGRDEEGQKSLATALALAPDRDLPLAQTSALFARVVADSRKALKDAPKGNLLVESSPSNAPVLVDGLALGATPLLVHDVPPGLHFYRAQLPNGEVVGGVVDVQAGKQVTVKPAATSKDPDARLLAAIAQNRLDADALAAVKEHAKNTEADLVLFGGLSKEGKGLALDAMLLVASTGELRRTSRATFDTELLSAGMEFFNLAGEMAKSGAKVGEAVKVPAMVSLGLGAQGPKQAEVKYGVVPGKELALEGTDEPKDADAKSRKPLERRGPLKKKP